MKVRSKVCALIICSFMIFITFVFAQEDPPQRYVREYRIGLWDVLEVSVYGEEDYSDLRVQVTEYGKIKLPLVDEVEVAGLTQGQLEERLNQLFIEKDIFHNHYLWQYYSKMYY